MKENKCALIICWFGNLPEYFPVFLKTCASNDDFDFLLFTDCEIRIELPHNVKYIPYHFEELKQAIENIGIHRPSLQKPYRVCDFRPMFGEIFVEQLKMYQFWGYCDVDVIFGKLNQFITREMLESYEAIFNGGHFTLIKNENKLNELYKKRGALFNYNTVSHYDGIFAFDEVTGIQRIAKSNNIKAIYHLPYIEAEIKYKQIVSRCDNINPENQCFYWEKGELYRCKIDKDRILYQNVAYIHLQKRKIRILGAINDTFWIKPNGYEKKEYYGKPSVDDLYKKNPFLGTDIMEQESKNYRRKKIREILGRTPIQIYIRVRQEFAHINQNDNAAEERSWKEF